MDDDFKKTYGLIVAYYSHEGLLSNDIIQLCDAVKDDYKIVLSFIGELRNLDRLDPKVTCVKYGDKGYDLNCYIHGMDYLIKKVEGLSHFIFMNNSVEIINVNKFKGVLLKIETLLRNNDFVGFAVNLELKPHYQSYLFGVNIENIESMHKVTLHNRLQFNEVLSRTDVIEKFELETIDFLNSNFLKHAVVWKPDKIDFVLGFLVYICKLGFLDNISPLLYFKPTWINPSTFLKRRLQRDYGFKKKKSTTIINKFFVK